MRTVNFLAVIAVTLLVSSCGVSTGAEIVADVQNEDLVTDLSSIEVGQSGTIQGLWVHCGAEFIGQVAGQDWAAVDAVEGAIDWIPAEWEPFINDQEEIIVTVTLVESDLLQVSPSPDIDPIQYQPTTQIPGCD